MKVLVKIKGKELIFINRKKLNEEYKNMLNTNIISNDEVVFSDVYIKENYKLMAAFLHELANNYQTNILVFQTMEVAKLLIPIVNRIKCINTINFISDELLPYKICEKLIKCNNIKYISAEYIQPFMFELLDKNGIVPESRSEILFNSNFMTINSLTNYSSIFYKTSIYIELPLNKQDLDDFNSFCDINKYLKTIHITTPNLLSIKELVYILKTNKRKNIKIILHNDLYDFDLIDYLKKNNKILKKKYNIVFRLKYSDKYIKDNIAKQTNNNILRMCGILIILIILFSMGYVMYDNYTSLLKVSKIQKEIENYIIAKNPEESQNEITDNPIEDNAIKNQYILELTNINPNIIGWLKVNNTNIDYAILQTNDNQYYLNYNIYEQKDENGWIFMDYENDPSNIDDNRILYGHNRYLNGVMFGTLNKVLYKSWYTNEENQIIRFDTMYGSFKYRIFSIYTILTTNDYLITNYDNDTERLAFYNKIKDRSIYDFNVNIDADSKIITLSTCKNGTTRLVVHGVLVEE